MKIFGLLCGPSSAPRSIDETIAYRTTPENLTVPEHTGDIFVFGSNYQGIHGAGAALTARQYWGAQIGKSFGGSGQSYAIPTKQSPHGEKVDLKEITGYVDNLLRYVQECDRAGAQNRFLITAIGCGLAGFEPSEIAPLFLQFVRHNNVWLPASFWQVLRPGLFIRSLDHLGAAAQRNE